MKLKIDQFLLDTTGKQIPSNGGDEPFLTLKGVCMNSILTPVQDDTEAKKLEKYDIYKKLRDAKDAKIEVDLTIEELATVKKCIGNLQPPLIMGQAFEMLEGK